MWAWIKKEDLQGQVENVSEIVYRLGAVGLAALIVGAVLPLANATDDIIVGEIVDENGAPLQYIDVEVTNLDNSQSTTATTDSNGLATVAAASLGVTSGSLVQLALAGSLTFNGCSVPVAQTAKTTWTPGTRVVMPWFGTPPSIPTAPTTLASGATTALRDKNANPKIVLNTGLHMPLRVQGNGNPWGSFAVSQDFRLRDNDNNLAGLGGRSYQFLVTVSYLGYYDQSCNYVDANPDPSDDGADGGATAYYANFEAGQGAGFDSTVTNVNTGNLPANNAGNGANDLLMAIVVTFDLDQCDPLAAQTCPGALDISVSGTFYVEP